MRSAAQRAHATPSRHSSPRLRDVEVTLADLARGAGWASEAWNRVIRMQRFGWKSDGTPVFGLPVPSSQELAVPSGEYQ